MRNKIPLKFFAKLLLVVMLTVAINGVHENSHAMQSPVAAADDHGLNSDNASATHQCPCPPFEQHKDCDGCDNCINCTCHAPLTVQPLQLDYKPIIVNLSMSDSFKHLPEVYLSKFIPPQIQA